MNSNRQPDDNEVLEVNGINFTHKQIFMVVDDFYTRIQNDPLLQVPFKSVHDWPEHIERLTHFWWIRFGGRSYLFSEYNPALKHFFAGFNQELLERWLELFHDTLDEHLSPEQSDLWKRISERMGQALSHKNEMLKRQYAIDPEPFDEITKKNKS